MTKYAWLLIGRESARANAQGGEETRLFVRGDESIRITAHRSAMTVKVFGPGRVQKSHEFTSAADFGKFLDSFRQQMTANGWTLLDVAERRQDVAGRTDQIDGRLS